MALPDLLELDAAVFADYWSAVLDDVAGAGRDVHRIVDLGSGTGTGALGLAHRFPDAEVIAVDSSDEMLAALTAKSDRITALLADLDAGWPAVDGVDITFASMSLHHMGDPERLLREVFAATRPGGIVAAAEFREPVRVLRDDYRLDDTGTGIEQRALARLRAGHPLPELEAHWPSRLQDAGFEMVAERAFDIEQRPPVSADAQAYASLWLERMRQGADDHLEPAARDELGDAIAAVTSTDLHLHGRRTLTIARRP